MASQIPLRCECGTVTGFVETGGMTCRGSCYCRDCRAYARFLGRPERVLDDRGGTQVIATLPSRLRFTSGAERIANVTMTGNGPFRWYAECCRSPIGNTPRSAKASYLGLLRCTLAAPDEEVARAFGPPTFASGTGSATGPVRGTPVAMTGAVFKVVGNMLSARLSGQWRGNPFFRADGTPIRAPQALAPDARRALDDGAAR